MRFSTFATLHKDATWRLMELIEQSGMAALIGKVNMDRNAPDTLIEKTEDSLRETEKLILKSKEKGVMLAHPDEKALQLPEALYLATKKSGSFFGKVGSFEQGYDFDALVIRTDEMIPRTPFEKLEQYIYDGDDRNIVARYCRGEKVEKPFEEGRMEKAIVFNNRFATNYTKIFFNSQIFLNLTIIIYHTFLK